MRRRSRHLRTPPGWSVALVAALVAAEAAVLLLRPRDGVIKPAPVEARSYFSPAELDRARDFRGPQRIIGLARTGVEVGVLVLLIVRPPRWLRRLASARRVVLAGALAGAGISVVVALAPLPLAAVARERARDVGLVTQSWGGWAGDAAKSTGIGAVFAGIGGLLVLALMRRFPRGWWAPGAAVIVVFGAAITYAGPVVLDPIFNKFTKLPEGTARSDVLELARRAGVDVGEVYEVDASRRTTGANAYVTGLGSTKRVVLYDTLLENFERDELRLVVAHELAHVHHRDVPNGILYLVLVAPLGVLAVRRLTERMAGGDAIGTAAALPALAVSLVVVSTPIVWISNQLSRRIEARADSFALELTRQPQAFIDFERRITLRNVSDPDPPGWVTALMGTHPPTLERIGVGEAFRRGETSTAAARRRRTPGGS